MRSALVILLALAILTPSRNADGADAALIEAARKEGKVVWYTTLIVNQAIRPLKAAFEKKYPGIELQYARADETPTAAKILEEGVAGRVQADIFDGITNMIPLKRARLLASYVPAAAANTRPSSGTGRVIGTRSCSTSSHRESTPRWCRRSARRGPIRTCSIRNGRERWPGTRTRSRARSGSSATFSPAWETRAAPTT